MFQHDSVLKSGAKISMSVFFLYVTMLLDVINSIPVINYKERFIIG